jgi:hypothetical protein
MLYKVQFPNRDAPLFEAHLDSAADSRLSAFSHHYLYGNASRNCPEAVACGKRYLLGPLQRFQHLARKRPAFLVTAGKAELA